ncbi:MAG: HlyD family secretion protein [Bacteroidales bacterium]|nr:HlyD family secretion protein [Bacteroidales bacterium]
MVLLAVVAAIVALPFIAVPITTQARGIVRSPNENNTLQTAVYGEVTEIRISENLLVTQGDTLLVLKAENITVQIDRSFEKIQEDSAFIADISALLSGKFSALQTPKYLNEKNLFISSDNEQKTKIEYLKHEVDVSEQLYQKDAISKSDYLRDKNNYDNALRVHENLREQYRNRWQAEHTNYELEIKELYSHISQLEDEKTKYAVLAPVSGSIIKFAGIQRGSFIAPAQPIAYISNDSNLLVECYISPADIGYIEQNQRVKFQLDAFNYNQWGLATGVVTDISSDIISKNDQTVFRVRCSLETPILQLKNVNKGN